MGQGGPAQVDAAFGSATRRSLAIRGETEATALFPSRPLSHPVDCEDTGGCAPSSRRALPPPTPVGLKPVEVVPEPLVPPAAPLPHTHPDGAGGGRRCLSVEHQAVTR